MAWIPLEAPSKDDLRALKQAYRGKARFLVDENLGTAVANFLKDSGYNAKFVQDLSLSGRSDEDVFALAWKEERVILTHDTDFLDDRQFPPHRNSGVVVIHPGADGRDDEGLTTCLMKILTIAGDSGAWFHGRKVDFTSDETITISSQKLRQRYFWPKKGQAMIWEE